jgi:ATP-dependent Clp protease ATP-binding subunit ClpA
MFQRLSPDAREAVADAREIARELISPTVEAEHLLLALARRPPAPAASVLAELGLDYDGTLSALEAETTRSLGAVGVAFELPPASPFPNAPRWATSTKAALEHALRVTLARGDQGIQSAHLLLAVLRPGIGTVARALDCAGVDRATLIGRLETTL